MGVFPENPCEFAVEFIRRMRNHPDIIQIPSPRQVLSIPKLILSRYYRKGSITPNDFIEISTVTSFPDNQTLAKDMAFEILFPNYKKDLIKSFFIEKDDGFEDQLANSGIKSEFDQLQDLIDEIELSKSFDTDMIQQLEEFMEELNQKRNKEPYKSALNLFNDNSELYKEEITSFEKLLEEAKNRMLQKINSLDPKDLKDGTNLGLNDLIQERTLREWERITSKALNNQNIEEDLNKLLSSGSLEDLLQSMKFLKDTNAISKEKFENLKNELYNKINNLDQLFQASKQLGETPKFNQDEILNNSIKRASFEHNFNLANSLDQFYGTNLRSSLLDKFDQQSENSQMFLSLENLTKTAFANKSWNSLFKQVLKNAIDDAMSQNKKFEAFKSLTHNLQQLMNSCQNIHCSQKMAQNIPNLTSLTLESCETPYQLRNATEFLRKIGLNPESDDIKKFGKKLDMPEDQIFELIEPTYQLLKKLVENKNADFQRLSNLMNQIQDQLNYERIKELTASALASDNRDALGALGNFNLSDALKSAQQIGGQEGENKMISCLSAGSGENLLKQWFIHRKNLTETTKQKVKELAKKMLIELGIYYSRARLGSSTTGPIPINIVRPYSIGDDFENIDLEETINNILEKGKKLDHIKYDDFFVFETAKGLRTACFELDISGSMTGDKLAYMSICVTMLCYGMRKDEIGITFFESNTHVLKELHQKIDLEKLADDLLSVTARGGTRLQSAIEWANKQFKEHSNSREKLNVLFTDAEIFDLKEVLQEFRKMRSLGVDFILICPEASYNLNEAKKMVKVAGGQLLTIKDWNEFPKLISEIIKSRF
ncbi:MAG: VWA domain-containing protein [Candidatus Lokiarchaeota archaeon]|nr:VWA domain-containing protein [Candidatus Lokiarchaeota archaeon]